MVLVKNENDNFNERRKKKKKKKNFKLYFNSLLYVAHILGLQELNEIYFMLTVEKTYGVRKIFLKI